jgi:hypothetical protein
MELGGVRCVISVVYGRIGCRCGVYYDWLFSSSLRELDVFYHPVLLIFVNFGAGWLDVDSLKLNSCCAIYKKKKKKILEER